MKDKKVVLRALLCSFLVVSLILPGAVAGASSESALVADEGSGIHPAVGRCSASSTMPLTTQQGQVAPMVSAGWYDMVGLKSDGTVVAAGLEVELAEWNLWGVPKSYDLTVGSTAGGTVTSPGEGTFTYDAGTVVDLVAEADPDYYLVNWTGDVDTIDDVYAYETTIIMDGSYEISASFEGPPPLPHVFYGEVKINGEPAPVGTQVEARGEGVRMGIRGNPVTVTDKGKYGGIGVGQEPLVVQGDIAEGTEIEFYVSGHRADQTALWQSGDITELDLTVEMSSVTFRLIVSSTPGGSVTEPGEGTFAYDAGTVVGLVAEANESYRFVEWTGETADIDDPGSASTTITMWGDYEIAASFEAVELVVQTTGLPDGHAGVAYETTLEAAGGTEPYTWEWTADEDVQAFPPGLDLTAETGLISGMPTEAGTFNFIVQVTDAVENTATRILLLSIMPAGAAQITGVTREVNCNILPGVPVTLYQNGALMTSTVSGLDGHYTLAVPGPGEYTVVAGKAGFRDEQQSVSVDELTTYTVHFVGSRGLIPNAPNMSYVLACINLWQFGEPPCKLTMSRVLAVINAWQFPILAD